MRDKSVWVLCAILLFSWAGPSLAASPPERVNFQGVLRDNSGNPLDGDHDMVFRFFSTAEAVAATCDCGVANGSPGCNEPTCQADVCAADSFCCDSDWDAICAASSVMFDSCQTCIGTVEALSDSHVGPMAVNVNNGLFAVALGSGTVSPGAGPGVFARLSKVFRELGEVFVEIEVDGEVLTPRIRIEAAAWALNAGGLDVREGDRRLTVNHFAQPSITAGTAGDASLRVKLHFEPLERWVARGDGTLHWGGGAAELDTNLFREGPDRLRTDDTLVVGSGIETSGVIGINSVAELDGRAGVFTNGGYTAVLARRTSAKPFDVTGAGGEFSGLNTHAYLAQHKFEEGTYGIDASGSVTGGFFSTVGGSGMAYTAIGDTGIEASGSAAGGFFYDSDGTGVAMLGYGDVGIEASGAMGGVFTGSPAVKGTGLGTGSAAMFSNNGYSATFASYFTSPFGDTGRAGNFDGDGSYAEIATYRSKEGPYGIFAGGGEAGGYFESTSSSAFAYVGIDDSKITGSGSVSFMQNHPYNADEVIVYIAPEGDEAATYTRGTAQLVDGEARIPLGETFQWVTNPDIGLTAYLTPVGDWADLYIAEKSTTELVVRSGDGASDAQFDYMVYGLRIGFEEASIVREKKREAYIPSMNHHRGLYAKRPDLRRFNSLERFQSMEQAKAAKTELDLSAANALRSAIQEYDPAVHGPVTVRHSNNPGGVASASAGAGGVSRGTAPDEGDSTGQTDDPSAEQAASDQRPRKRPLDTEGQSRAGTVRSLVADTATLVDVTEIVEVGDVVVIDPEHPGSMSLARVPGDSRVFGIVAGAGSCRSRRLVAGQGDRDLARPGGDVGRCVLQGRRRLRRPAPRRPADDIADTRSRDAGPRSPTRHDPGQGPGATGHRTRHHQGAGHPEVGGGKKGDGYKNGVSGTPSPPLRHTKTGTDMTSVPVDCC